MNRSSISGTNILALIVIIMAVGIMIHGPFGPELRETNIRKTTGMVWRNLYAIGDALEKYKVDNGGYPGKTLMNLTTPVAYLETLLFDPNSKENNDFIYISHKGNWILSGRGPDGILNISKETAVKKIREPEREDLKNYLTLITYDPTNGISTSGDIILDKERFLSRHDQSSI